MEAEIIKLLTNLGPAAGVVIVVFLFLRHFDRKDTLLAKELSELRQAIEKLTDKATTKKQS